MRGRVAGQLVTALSARKVSQAEIWPKIAKVNRFGSLACNTHLMVQDALDRGFVAIAIQAKHPLQAFGILPGQRSSSDPEPSGDGGDGRRHY